MAPRRVVPAIALALVSAVLGPLAPASAAPGLIYDNGGLNPTTTSSSGVAAPSGSFFSELQHTAAAPGVSNGAVGYDLGAGTRLADDFTVPTGQQWTVSAVQSYASRSTGSTPMPFTDGTLRIWSGRPGDPGSVPLFGDVTTDRLVDSVSTSTYRIGDTTALVSPATAGTTELIYRNTFEVAPGLTLGPGTYWIDWDVRNSGGSAPAVTVAGQRTQPGWNARRFYASTWSDLVDTGNRGVPGDRVAQDLPFVLVGSVVSTPPTTTPAPPAPSAPDTALGRTPKKKTPKKKAVFTLTSTTAGASFECSLNGAAYAPCGATTKVKAKKGKNTFAARAVSAGVPDGSPATWSWRWKRPKPR